MKRDPSTVLQLAFRLSFATLLTVAMLVGIPATSGASKVKIASFGSTGAGLGQFSSANSPRGIGVNGTTGHVYVGDFNNQRIDVFTAGGAPIRAWGNRVVASGGQGFATQASAVQTLTVTATGGSFKLRFSGSETAALPYNSSATAIRDVLAGLSSIGVGNVTVTGTGPYTITFAGALANSREPAIVAESDSGVPLTGGTASISVVNPGSTGFTICNAVSSPQDVCVAGTGSALAGGMTGPTGVAVDQLTGAVYVTEQNNRRVSKYDAGGEWIASWGLDVVRAGEHNVGTGVFEVCQADSDPVDICQAGVTGALGGAFSSGPPAFQSRITVDPTSHNVYVTDQANNRVQEFSSSGGFVRTFGFDVDTGGGTGFEVCTTTASCKKGLGGNAVGQFGEGTGASRVAVDSAGNVYVVDFVNQRVQRFSPDGGSFTATLFGPSGADATPFALAVDPDDHVLIGRLASGSGSELQVAEYDSSGTLLDTHGVGSQIAQGVANSVTAVSGDIAYHPGNGSIYVDFISSTAPKVSILNFAPPPGVDYTTTTDVSATSATLNGTVTPPAPSDGVQFQAKWRFEYSADGIHWTKSPVPDGDAGSVNTAVAVQQELAGLRPNTAYQVRLCAATGTEVCDSGGAFLTGPKAPEIVATWPEEVTQTDAVLGARVNPNNLPTTYHFEWASDDEWQANPGDYPHRLPAFERQLGSGSAIVTARDAIGGLSPASTYHFRIVASNAADPGTSNGPDQTFETLNACGFVQHRCLELVSPADKGPAAQAGRPSSGGVQLPFQAGPSGSVAYQVGWGLSDTTSNGEILYRGDRDAAGWSRPRKLTAPELAPVSSRSNALVGITLGLASDLGCSIESSGQPLTADTPQETIDGGGFNLFRRDADGSYTVITKDVPENLAQAVAVGDSAVDLTFRLVDMSDDCRRAVFITRYKYPGISGTEAFATYQWFDGELRRFGEVPSPGGPVWTPVAFSTFTPGSTIGGAPADNNEYYKNAVSSDGSSVYFLAVSQDGDDAGKRAIFRRTEGAGVVDVSQSQTSTPANGAMYHVATESGSSVFFTANYGLAGSVAEGKSSAGPQNANCITDTRQVGNCDLYKYDPAKPVGQRLTDLSVPQSSADNPTGAGVAGVVGISENGEDVYFLARGQLVSGEGKTNAENVSDSTLSLYRSSAGQLKFVATVATQDRNTLSIDHSAASNQKWTSQVTPDGDHLIFVTRAQVTEDGDGGGVGQAYLYDATDESTVCISCRRDGEDVDPSDTVLEASNSGSSNILHPPKIMSDDASTVVFGRSDRLAPGAVQGQRNLYLWKDGQVSFVGTSDVNVTDGIRFIGFSTDEKDLFFMTYDALNWQDKDAQSDIYDLRVGGGFSQPADPDSPCDPLVDGSCQGSGTGRVGVGIATGDGGDGAARPPARARVSVAALGRAQRARLVDGRRVQVVVRTSRPGTVSVRGVAAIGGLRATVIAASRRSAVAGRLKVPVVLSRAALRRLGRTGALRVVLTVRLTGASKVSRRLRLVRPRTCGTKTARSRGSGTRQYNGKRCRRAGGAGRNS